MFLLSTRTIRPQSGLQTYACRITAPRTAQNQGAVQVLQQTESGNGQGLEKANERSDLLKKSGNPLMWDSGRGERI
jgi:hypothetical protein